MTEEQEKFEELVKIAEKYIEEKALKVLNAKRKSEDKEYKDVENCYELISSKYKPMYTINNNENVKPDDYLQANKDSKYYEESATTLKGKLLVRFCIQLQNYQAMPKAINYASFSKPKDNDNDTDEINVSNDIFEIAKKYLTEEKAECTAIYDEFKKIKKFEEKAGNRQFNKKEEENLRQKFYKDEKYIYNHAWLKYSEGLADAINFLINKKDDLKNLIKNVNNFFQDKPIEDFDEKIIQKFNTNLSKEFYQKIKYISTTLSYDFFKEIGCRNLLKDDVHIVAIYEHVFDNKEDDGKKHKKLVADMLNFCKSYQNIDGNKDKDTYYIDKILWLCCTGAFYEDDIIITSMNRKNFLDYYDEKSNK